MGYASEIFCEDIAPELARDIHPAASFPDSPDTVLVVHFSWAIRFYDWLRGLSCRKVLVYHNITPPEYFVGINKELVESCYLGRRELTAYAARCELAVGDSEFNRAELEGLGFAPTGVLPVVPDFSHLDGEPEAFTAREFDDDWTNVLFVGRVIPNKRFEDLIRIFDVYKREFNPRTRLLLVGSFGVLAVIIAAVGIAGVLAFSVSARTREFGVRLAMGSAPRQVLTSVLSEGALIAAIGILAGAAGDLQALVDVPHRQPPAFLLAEAGDFGQGVFVLVGLNPEAGKAGGDVLRQVLREGHGVFP